MIAALLGLIVAVIAGVVLIGLTVAAFGLMIGLVVGLVGLAFKLLPLVLVGWVVVKVVKHVERPRALSGADQRWLDSPM
jgi:hypothetical protein